MKTVCNCPLAWNRPHLSLATRSFGLGTASPSRLLARYGSGVRFHVASALKALARGYKIRFALLSPRVESPAPLTRYPLVRVGHRLAISPAGSIWLRRSIPRRKCLKGTCSRVQNSLRSFVPSRGIEPRSTA